MKLELKHLDFVNNGKVKLSRLPHWEFKEVDLQDCILAFNPTDKEPFLRYKGVTFGLNQVTPYKRPLSDLTKEIEVNGEKFVPLFELLKMAVNEKDYNEGCFNSEILHDFNVLGNFSVEAFYSKCRFVFIYYKDSMTFSLFEPQGVDLHCGFKYMQKLIEWHFDIHGLIEKGLTIEKQ